MIGAIVVINSTMGSSLPSNALPPFHRQVLQCHVLDCGNLANNYLSDWIFREALAWGPLSEAFGRRWMMMTTFFFFTIFTLACAVAPNWGSLNVFRFFCGMFASSPIAIIGGIYADIYDNPADRGKAMAVFIGVCSHHFFPYPQC